MNKEQEKLSQASIKETRRMFLETLKANHDLLTSHGVSRVEARDSNFVTVVGTLSVTMASMLGNEFGWDFDIDDNDQVQRRYLNICNLIANSLANDMRKFRDQTKDNSDPKAIVDSIIEGLRKGSDDEAV